MLALQDFTLPRCIVPSSKVIDVHFHLFTDASESAYSAVVYSRIVGENGFISTNLVAGKTRVAPIKTIFLPRLELCGAHLGTKLLTKVLAVMEISKFQNGDVQLSCFGASGTFFSAGVLPTAIVTIEDQASNTHTCRALLDTGSQMNLHGCIRISILSSCLQSHS